MTMLNEANDHRNKKQKEKTKDKKTFIEVGAECIW